MFADRNDSRLIPMYEKITKVLRDADSTIPSPTPREINKCPSR